MNKHHYTDLLTETTGTHDYGCVYITPSIEQRMWDSFASHIIKPNDVYKSEPGYGIEHEPHVTLLYGIHPEVTIDDIYEALSQVIEPISIAFESAFIDSFTQDRYDVVKLNVSKGRFLLTQINNALRSLPHTNDYPVYSPHMTISYVKSGFGPYYKMEFMPPLKFCADKIIYSTSDNQKFEISLT